MLTSGLFGFYPFALAISVWGLLGHASHAAPPPPQLSLESVKSTVTLGESWPIRFSIVAQEAFSTCAVKDWPSRVVWTVTRNGNKPVALAPYVTVQSASVDNSKPYVLPAGKALSFRINLRQYQPLEGQWEAGLYKISAKVSLCNSASQSESGGESSLWINSQNRIYLDVINKR